MPRYHNLPEVEAALDHVRQFHPEVDCVIFTPDHASWRYLSTETGSMPALDKRVKVDILERAQAVVDNTGAFPGVFFHSSFDEGY